MRGVIGCAVVLAASWASVAQAGDFFSRSKTDFWRMNSWPEPFRSTDEQLARQPFAVMESRGWVRQNTLGDEYFDSETQQLSRSGEIKVRWILTQAPENRRSIFVLRGATEDATTGRLDAVQLAASRILVRGQLPDVLPTSVPGPGWPADYVDAIDKASEKSIPAPRLPDTKGGGGSSGGM